MDSVSEAVLASAKPIKLAVFDVDGVMTDGHLFLSQDGREYRSFHVRDGLGLVMLKAQDIEVAIITARRSAALVERMQSLGIQHIYQGYQNKGKMMLSLIQKLALTAEQVCYTGDDLIDLSAMRHVGLKIAVANAHQKVREFSDWTTVNNGGQGAVREICEMLLFSQDKLDLCLQKYL